MFCFGDIPFIGLRRFCIRVDLILAPSQKDTLVEEVEVSPESLALVRRNREKITNDMGDRFAGTQVILKVYAQIESLVDDCRRPPPRPLHPRPCARLFCPFSASNSRPLQVFALNFLAFRSRISVVTLEILPCAGGPWAYSTAEGPQGLHTRRTGAFPSDRRGAIHARQRAHSRRFQILWLCLGQRWRKRAGHRGEA